MRSLILLWALILVLGLTSISYAESAGDGPTSAPAVAARKKLDGFVAKADREQADFLTAAREAYLTSLKQALDAAMNAASLDAAKWAKAEIERIKAGEPASAEKPKLAAAAAAQSRFLRAGEKAQEDRKRSLEAARKQYISELEAAKRTALSVAKDLDEAGRIAAEIERAKVMEFGEATIPGAGVPANTTADGSADRKPGKINLLKLVDLERDQVLYGIFQWEKDGLLIDGGGSWKTLRIPYQPPVEYDYVVEFTILEFRNSHDFVLNASIGDRGFAWASAGNANKVCWLGPLGGRWDSSASLRMGKVYDTDKRITTTVKVRATSVSGWIEDKQITKFDASDFANVTYNSGSGLTGLQALGIGTSNKMIIHSAEVTEISGPGRIIRHLDAQQMRAQAQAFRTLRAGKTVSLTELKPRAAQVGGGEFMINRNQRNQPVTIDGRECAKYLFAYAPSSLVYDIPKGAIGFRALGIPHAGDFPVNIGQWRYAVCVDDCEVFLSHGIREAGGKLPIEVPLPKGARQIELRTDPMGIQDWDFSIWANPEFLFPQ